MPLMRICCVYMCENGVDGGGVEVMNNVEGEMICNVKKY